MRQQSKPQSMPAPKSCARGASLECYLSSSAYPGSRVRQPLRLNGTSASLVLDHASSLLSINHDLFVRAVFSSHA